MQKYDLEFYEEKHFDEFMITLSFIGEGNEGDYNIEDKEDKPLLRYDILQLVDGDYQQVENASYCTQLDCSIEQFQAEAVIQIIADKALNAVKEGSHKRICEHLSWLSLNDIKDIKQKTFKEASIESKTFIKRIAEVELGQTFTIEQLDALMGEETDKFLASPLDVYSFDEEKYPISNRTLDTFDRFVVRDHIWQRIMGVSSELFEPKELAEYMEETPNWVDNLFDIGDLRQHLKARQEETHRLMINVGKYRDYVSITSDKVYADVINEFLLENKDDITKRLKNAIKGINKK